MKRPDIASGLVLAGLGVFVTQQAARLTYRDEFGPGPGLLPFWLGLLLIALASCLAVFSLRRKEKSGEVDRIPSTEFGQPHRISRVLLAWLSLVVTVAALNVLGFIVSLGLLSFFLVYVVERRPLRNAITVAVAIALSFLLLFRAILPVPLPVSPWGF